MIKNSNNYDIFSEKVLQKLILEDIENFLDELGNGFTFIKSEYPIKVNDRYNYIDLLLYNINYIDKNIKEPLNNNTMGILICKKENKFVIEYCSDERIAVRKYELV